jgi:hypothetical protein
MRPDHQAPSTPISVTFGDRTFETLIRRITGLLHEIGAESSFIEWVSQPEPGTVKQTKAWNH